jgi:ribonuclease HII
MTPPKQKKFKRPGWSIEKTVSGIVCGIDEVGRAPLAGPVVAACAYIPEEVRRKRIWSKVNDSKQLTREQREEIYDGLTSLSCYAIGQAGVEEINSLNIYYASLLAMQRAFEQMCNDFGICPEIALIDGNATPEITCKTQTVVKGDATSLSIAAASIIAKVWRDRLMSELHEEFPYYGWNTNCGYGTREHLEGIDQNGITPHHRSSFAPVRNYIEYGCVEIQQELDFGLAGC